MNQGENLVQPIDEVELIVIPSPFLYSSDAILLIDGTSSSLKNSVLLVLGSEFQVIAAL